MISKPTVLILGAGASFHAGYPIGMQLVTQICTNNSRPVIGPLPTRWSNDDWNSFTTRLSRSAHSSIDAFLELSHADANLRKNDADLGKFLIAQTLKQNETTEALFPMGKTTWYHTLFQSMLVKGKPNFEKNKLSIITFNYDRSLEHFIFTALCNGFGMKEVEAMTVLQQIPIIHIHGILGSYPDTTYSTAATVDELLAISHQIKIIGEIQQKETGFCSPEFEMAWPMLNEADRIFFLGFGFHPDNIERFNFFKPDNLIKKEIHATNVGFRAIYLEQLRKRLGALGIIGDAIPREDDRDCSKFFEYVAPLE